MRSIEERIEMAATYARAAHEGQTRDDGATEYFEHVARVADGARANDLGGDAICAAYLHDTLEDTDATHEDIEATFGGYVGFLVLELTNEFTKAAYPHLNRAQRKARELHRLRNTSRVAQALKLIDRIDNLADIGFETERDRQWAALYAQESLALAAALRDLIDETLPHERSVNSHTVNALAVTVTREAMSVIRRSQRLA